MDARSGAVRTRAGALVLLAALATAFVAQFLFTGEAFTRLADSNTWTWLPRYTAGTVLLLGVVALSFWVARRSGADDAPVKTPLVTGRRVRWAAGVSAGLTVLAIAVFVRTGETLLIRLLWAGALLALTVPLLLDPEGEDSASWPAWESLAVLGLTLVGFFLRFYRLSELPEHADNDVALMGIETLRLMDAQDGRWFGLARSDHLFSAHQIKALSMLLFGQDHFGLVMLSVVTGTLTLPVLYVLGRDAFGRPAALIATALLTTSYTHIHFSRILFGPVATFFLTLSLALALRAVRTGRAFCWAAGGLSMGLSLLTYYSSRVGPVIVVLVLVLRGLWDPRVFRARLPGWALFVLGAFVGFGPMMGFVLRDFSRFVGRGNSVMIWSPNVLAHSMDKYKVHSLPAVLVEQVKSTFLTLHLYGDGSPHFGFPRPMVGALAAALFAVGAGICLARMKRLPYLIALAWVVLTFLLGGVLTSDPPFWPHLNIALPAIVLVAGVGGERLLGSAAALLPRGRALARVLVAAALLASGIHNWVVYYRFASDNAGRRIETSRFLGDLPHETRVYLVADATSWHEYCFRFYNRGMSGGNASVDELVSGRVRPPIDGPFTIVLFGHEDAVPALQQAFPAARVERHGDRNGELLFHSLTFVPPGFQTHPVPEPARPGLILLLLATLGIVGWVAFRYRIHPPATEALV